MSEVEIYRAEQLPTFQNRMFDTAEAARECTKGDVVLVRDQATGLIYNSAFRPELMRYDADYQNEQAGSSVFRSHLEEVAGVIATHLSNKTLIEVGCGKGYFLEYLTSLGFDVTGLDPTYEGTNPRIIKSYFSADTGLKADGIVLRHVLEHVQTPVEFLRHIRTANSGTGKIYIEVPCFDWICNRRAWFDIFYEHVNYFRMDDFDRMFGKVYERGRVFGGQYLYVIADLESLREPRLEAPDHFAFPDGFLSTVESYVARARNPEKKGHTVIWGGASKGVIFALFLLRAGVSIDFVVDINPGKQGRFLPASGLRVWSPGDALERIDPGSTIFVMNGNYLAEIRNMTADKFSYIAVDS